jgi:glycosyltransferase involved in cell wall biosynthesis
MGHLPLVFAGTPDPRVNRESILQEFVEGIPVYRVHRDREDYDTRRVNFVDARVDRQFEMILQASRPDVVHMHNLIGLSGGILHAAKRRGARTVVTLHDYWGFCFKNTLIDYEQKICSDFSRCRKCQNSIQDGARAVPVRMRNDYLALQFAEVDAFISPSRYLAERYIEAGLPPEKMNIIPYGLDVDRFARVVKTPSHGTIRFSFIGYLGEHKGVQVLLDALSLLNPDAPIRLNIVGDGHLRGWLEQQVREKGFGPKVRMWGKVEHMHIDRAYSETDVQILPSIWPENQPISITEAMACRIPVIATRAG